MRLQGGLGWEGFCSLIESMAKSISFSEQAAICSYGYLIWGPKDEGTSFVFSSEAHS